MGAARRLIRAERESNEALMEKAIPLASCILREANGNIGLAMLYAQVMEVLATKSLLEEGAFGNDFRITPVTIGITPTQILDTDNTGRVRKVTLAVDSAVGGPNTIRVGQGAVSTNGGGFRINAGAFNELGEVGPDVKLMAVAAAAIQAYTIERL